MPIKLKTQIQQEGNLDTHGILYYKGLPDDLEDLDVYEPFKRLTTPPLSDNQSADVLKAVAFKRFCAFYDTGLGKTYLAGGFMRAVKNAIPNAKFLFVIRSYQASQTPRVIQNITGLRTVVFTGESSKRPTSLTLDVADVVFITAEFLNNVDHLLALNTLMDDIIGVVADEIHLFSNLLDASSSFALLCISKRVEYFLGLTATPVTTDVHQFSRILHIMNPWVFDNITKIHKEVSVYGVYGLPPAMQDCFVIRRRPKRRQGIILLVKPLLHQVDARGIDLFVTTKGPGAYNQLEALVGEIISHRPDRGIVYVNRKEVYKFLEEELPKYGIRFAILNGDKPKTIKEQDRILEDYMNDKYDVILTNKSVSLDMDGQFVIFYELTSSVTQFAGRVERGLETKPFSITYIITDHTDEKEYFYRNVVKISQSLEYLFGADLSEITCTSLTSNIKKFTYLEREEELPDD